MACPVSLLVFKEINTVIMTLRGHHRLECEQCEQCEKCEHHLEVYNRSVAQLQPQLLPVITDEV